MEGYGKTGINGAEKSGVEAGDMLLTIIYKLSKLGKMFKEPIKV